MFINDALHYKRLVSNGDLQTEDCYTDMINSIFCKPHCNKTGNKELLSK